MTGRFTIGGIGVAVHGRSIKGVVAFDWLHTVPGLPLGIDGLIEVDGEFIPLVDGAVAVPTLGTSAPPTKRNAVVLEHDRANFAIPIDVIGTLDDEDHGEMILLDGAAIWQRIAAMNGRLE